MKLTFAIIFIAFSLINAQLSPELPIRDKSYDKCESKAKNVTVEESKAKYSDKLKPFVFDNFNVEANWTLSDSDYTTNSSLVLKGSDLQGDYKLWKLRLVSVNKGSKHSLQSWSSPVGAAAKLEQPKLELHLISYNEEAKLFSILVFSFKEVKEENVALKGWLEDLKNKNAQLPWKLSTVIPSDLKVYYRYDSKSVDSSCDNIKWTIFETQILVSSEQLSLLYKSPEGNVESVPSVTVKELFTSKPASEVQQNPSDTASKKNPGKQAKVPESSSNVVNIGFSSLFAALGLNLLFL